MENPWILDGDDNYHDLNTNGVIAKILRENR